MDDPKFEKISEDERGANWRILLPDGRELVLIYSKADTWRGGHSHDTNEVALLLDGQMEYIKRAYEKEKKGQVSMLSDKDSTLTIYPGDSYRNRAGEPHIGHFTEESWLIDWKLGPKAVGFTTTNYPRYREKVRKPSPV
jgi:hypothetical protein